jgi:two-component system phosphate regulon sensor histidine kinase PhoR
MLGLIVVQIKWIRNAIELHDKQFRQLVNTTLADVSRQVDHYYVQERMSTVLDEKLTPSTEISWNVIVEEGDLPALNFDGEEVSEIKSKKHIAGDDEDVIEVIGDSIIIIQNDKNNIDTVLLSVYYQQVEQKKLEASIKEQENLVNTYMKKVLLEDASFEERVEQKVFEEILLKNIENHGINLVFEYTVIKNNKKEIDKSKLFDKKTDCYYYRAGLMNDQFLDEDTFLYLYFPGQKAHVRSSMGFLGSLTVFLTLFMIILFSFALYVIFRQKRLSDVKNDFVNNMTHELKTPISTISLASQMLSDDSIPDEKKNISHISRIIQTESKRLGYQVERVLQMAVLDQGHLIMKKSQVEMGEIIATVIQNFKLQVESKNGKLEVRDESNLDIVDGDRVHLMNVVTNLLDNAVKYSKEKPMIEVGILSTSTNFILTVKDEGIGINKENQKKVFDRFFRVSTGNVHDVKGFGLGLSYVKLIVEQHGGSIHLSSELNKGTKFTITLPLYSEIHTT